jgi:hypothetical protein
VAGRTLAKSGHLVIWSSGHLVIWSSGHLVIWLIGHWIDPIERVEIFEHGETALEEILPEACRFPIGISGYYPTA